MESLNSFHCLSCKAHGYISVALAAVAPELKFVVQDPEPVIEQATQPDLVISHMKSRFIFGP